MVKQRISIKDVEFYIGTNRVGGAEEASFTISRGLEEAHEGGNYFAVELVSGKISVAGTLTRAYIDNELLNILVSNSTGIWSSFDITGTVVSGKTPGRDIVFHGAEVESIDINGLGLDGYAKNALNFKALSWEFPE